MTIELKIESLAYGGNGVGRVDGKVFFVPYTAPGDEVTVEIVKDKKRYAEARLVEIKKASPHRVEPRCEYFTKCGGCNLQHISYEEQVRAKGEILSETIARIGGTDSLKVETVESPSEYNYRARARFQVAGPSWGFFEARSKTIVDIDQCPLLMKEVNDCYSALKSELSGALPGLKAVEIAYSEKERSCTALLRLTRAYKYRWGALVKRIPILKGLEVRAGKGAKGERIASIGDSTLSFSVESVRKSFRFQAALGSFTQVNPGVNNRLVAKVLASAALTGKERVVDLYCGVGNLTLPLAASAARVTGVERGALAVGFAEENARENGVDNVSFKAQSVSKWLERAAGKELESELLDVVVLDPPRTGDSEAASMLAAARPRRIVYVSCSPPTLARDIKTIISVAEHCATEDALEAGPGGGSYSVTSLTMIDLFPQTFHIEAVLGLDRTD